MKIVTHKAWLDELQAQGVPRKHVATKCPICGTVQSMASLERAGATEADAMASFGFSCVGRFTNAGPHKRGDPPGKGCDWSLGGLLRLHEVEVVLEGGAISPAFEVASPDEAKALMAELERENG
jgi:hypothetical protein